MPNKKRLKIFFFIANEYKDLIFFFFRFVHRFFVFQIQRDFVKSNKWAFSHSIRIIRIKIFHWIQIWNWTYLKTTNGMKFIRFAFWKKTDSYYSNLLIFAILKMSENQMKLSTILISNKFEIKPKKIYLKKNQFRRKKTSKIISINWIFKKKN